MDDAFDRLRDRIAEVTGHAPRVTGDRFEARCPAHDDHAPSLGARRITGQVLVWCQVCQDNDKVMRALGWTTADLYDDRKGATYRYDNGRIVKRYYENGKKRFAQSGDKSTVELYHLRQLRDAGPGAIYLVEGEKDVHAIESLGGVATTAPQGAGNFAKVDIEPLRGRDIIAVVDKDESGHKWAVQVAAKVKPVVASLWFVQATTGKDAADHIAAGHDLDDFEDVDGPSPAEIGDAVIAGMHDASVNRALNNPTTHEPAQPETEPQGRRLRLTWASDIAPRATQWLWETTTDGNDTNKWLPLVGLSLLGGREGVGKTTWAYHLAAQVTTGTLPGDLHGQAKAVIIAATEDDWHATIVPRLMAAGADLNLVGRAEVEEDGQIEGLILPADIPELRQACIDHKVALIILDPLMGTISTALDTHKDAEVRKALQPLSQLAHDAQLAIIGLIHANKSQGVDLATRLMASRAFAAVARAILYAARQPTDSDEDDDQPTGPERHLLGQIKTNLGPKIAHAVLYHTEGVRVGYDDILARDIWSSRVTIDGTMPGYMDELVAEQPRSKNNGAKFRAASKWLREVLAGGPMEASKVKAAASGAGHAVKTVERAYAESIKGPDARSTGGLWALPIHVGDIGENSGNGEIGEMARTETRTKLDERSSRHLANDPPRATRARTEDAPKSPIPEQRACFICYRPTESPTGICDRHDNEPTEPATELDEPSDDDHEREWYR